MEAWSGPKKIVPPALAQKRLGPRARAARNTPAGGLAGTLGDGGRPRPNLVYDGSEPDRGQRELQEQRTINGVMVHREAEFGRWSSHDNRARAGRTRPHRQRRLVDGDHDPHIMVEMRA